ncbi:hypothetical protein DHODJN_24775 [Methylorubrum extorquens]
MSVKHSIRIRQIEAYAFRIDFGESFVPLLTDEPEPIGGGTGPSPEQVLIAAVSNCLCASLAFALGKYRQEGGGVSAEAIGRVARNAEGRLRLVGIEVDIALGAPAEFDGPARPRARSVRAVLHRVRERQGRRSGGGRGAGRPGQPPEIDRPETDREERAMSETQRDVAREPEDLARLFNERASAGDAEGLVALYEPQAVVAAGDIVATGHDEIRRFYTDLLARKSDFPEPETLPAIRNGDLALTFARLPNGALSVESARRQSDGTWRWAIDQLKLKPVAKS